jgi:4-amino-4-deoxy-L-arabinose transferase-like glycosyltransferase
MRALGNFEAAHEPRESRASMTNRKRSDAISRPRAASAASGDVLTPAGVVPPNPWAAFWPGALLSMCLLVPFLGKAHAVDDVTFLLQAQHILQDPWHPTAFDMVADSQRIRVSGSLVSGPVAAYLLVPSVLLGGAEWAAHLVPLVLLLLSVLATVAIGLRLGLQSSEARMAGLLLASTPAAVGMATTSMADVPAMAFGVIGMERVLAWRDERRWHQGIAAGLAFAAAALARPQLVLVLAVAAMALWAGPRSLALGRVHWKAWVPLLLAVAVIVAVSGLTADPSHASGDIISTTLARFQLDKLPKKFAAFSAHWVLTLPLALPWVIARWRYMLRDPVLLTVVLLAAVVLLAGTSPATSIGMAPIALLGVAAIADVLLDAGRRADRDQLWLGAWLLIPLATLAYVHVPPKYLVPSAPAVALLVARLLRRQEGRLIPAVGWAAVAIGALLSVLIVLADSEFTHVGRRVAGELIAPRVRAGERVWYSGAWGSQWYAMQAGAVMLANSPPYPASGDIIVTSAHTGGLTLRAAAALDSLASLRVDSRFGRVMSREAGAGFYSNWLGYLPWSWGNGEIEAVTVWRVR